MVKEMQGDISTCSTKAISWGPRPHQVWGRMRREWNPGTPLVGIQNGTASLEKFSHFSRNWVCTHQTTPPFPAISIQGNFKENSISRKAQDLYVNIHANCIWNSQDLDTTQPSTNKCSKCISGQQLSSPEWSQVMHCGLVSKQRCWVKRVKRKQRVHDWMVLFIHNPRRWKCSQSDHSGQGS